MADLTPKFSTGEHVPHYVIWSVRLKKNTYLETSRLLISSFLQLRLQRPLLL